MSPSLVLKGFPIQRADTCSLRSSAKELTAPPRSLSSQGPASKFLWKLLAFHTGVSRCLIIPPIPPPPPPRCWQWSLHKGLGTEEGDGIQHDVRQWVNIS